jgi:glutathione synthase/RimK-type ligase-like ATP-grasp enzyme
MIEIEKKEPYKILVLSALSIIRVLQKKLLKEENILLTVARLRDLSVLLSDKGTRIRCKGKSLKEYDFVWIQSAGMTRDVAYMVSLYLDRLGIPHTKPEFETTKLVDLVALSLNHVSIPKTYFCYKGKLLLQLPRIVKHLDYPFLVKGTVGYGGSDVHMINDAADFFKIVPDLSDKKKYTCQKFIPNKFDYRILVGDGIVLSGEKRVRGSDVYRNNAKLGAVEVFLEMHEIPPEVQSLAIRAAATLNLSWAGVDVVTNSETGQHYVMEVNRQPGLTKESSEIVAAETFLKKIKAENQSLQGTL